MGQLCLVWDAADKTSPHLWWSLWLGKVGKKLRSESNCICQEINQRQTWSLLLEQRKKGNQTTHDRTQLCYLYCWLALQDWIGLMSSVMNRTIKKHYRTKVPDVFVPARTASCEQMQQERILLWVVISHGVEWGQEPKGVEKSFALFLDGTIKKQNMTQGPCDKGPTLLF